MGEESLTVQEMYPEYNFVPTTYRQGIKIAAFQHKFDYVQNVKRKKDDGSYESFHILYKDGQFGVLFHISSCLRTISYVALPAKYEYKIDFIKRSDKSFTAIIKKNDKYGIYIWAYGYFFNKKTIIKPKYDEIYFQRDKQRFRAVKGDNVCYYDLTGNILK